MTFQVHTVVQGKYATCHQMESETGAIAVRKFNETGKQFQKHETPNS